MIKYYIEPQSLDLTLDSKIFRKSLLGSFQALMVFLIVVIIAAPLIKPKEEVLIPPQFAKIILTPPKKSSSDASSGRRHREESKGRSVNLVQVFKSTEVKKTTQNLLKGGVLQLLAKSNLMPDQKSKSRVNAMFGASKSKDLLASVSSLAILNTNVDVTALGGSGTGQGGSGVGYGKGGHGGVQGQGNGFVALNTLDAKVDEGLSKDEVGKVIHSHIAEVRYCYESSMIRNPSIQGKLITDFTIQGGGQVKTAKINMSNLGDSSLDQCILNRLTRWKFPKPRGGIDVAVVYPFIFKSLGK